MNPNPYAPATTNASAAGQPPRSPPRTGTAAAAPGAGAAPPGGLAVSTPLALTASPNGPKPFGAPTTSASASLVRMASVDRSHPQPQSQPPFTACHSASHSAVFVSFCHVQMVFSFHPRERLRVLLVVVAVAAVAVAARPRLL